LACQGKPWIERRSTKRIFTSNIEASKDYNTRGRLIRD
jgi:hypothetical protein